MNRYPSKNIKLTIDYLGAIKYKKRLEQQKGKLSNLNCQDEEEIVKVVCGQDNFVNKRHQYGTEAVGQDGWQGSPCQIEAVLAERKRREHVDMRGLRNLYVI
jgi:hypothetical protein